MNSRRNRAMKGAVKRKPANPWRLAGFLRPPGTRTLSTRDEVSVTSVMSVRGWSTGGPPRMRRARCRLLDGETLLLGVLVDRVLPRLQGRGRTLPLVDGLALDGVAGGRDELVDRIPLPAGVNGRGHLGVRLVDLLAAVERV